MKTPLFLSLAIVAIFTGNAFGYSELQDEYSLELKGFSPEIIKPVQIQIDRMEGRYPPPHANRLKQTLYNLVNGEWGASMRPFPYDSITPAMLPKRVKD